MKMPYLCLLLGAAVFAGILAADPTYPEWWIDQDVVEGDAQPPAPTDPGYDTWMQANYAPANLGQAKNLAKAAYLTMEAAETDSAGTELATLVSGFSTDPADNYVPLNLGQLKYMVKFFIDRFHEEDFPIVLADGTILLDDLDDGNELSDNAYPWNPATPVGDNYAPANLGQLKHVFSFSLEGWPDEPPFTDTDDDLLPDDWELAIVNSTNDYIYDPNGLITNIADILPSEPADPTGYDSVQWDYDGDGIDNRTEWQNGTDADDYYNAQAPQLFKISGDYQLAVSGTYCISPYIVLVLDASGAPLKNAPVVHSVTAGSGSLDSSSSSATQKIVRSDAYGRTPDVFFYQTETVGNTSTITSQAGASSVSYEAGVLTQRSGTRPVPTTNVTREINPDGSLTVSWTDNSDNEHNTKVLHRDSHGRTWQVGVAPADAETVTIPAAVIQALEY